MDLQKDHRENGIVSERVQIKRPGVTVTYVSVFTSRFVTLVICMLDCPCSLSPSKQWDAGG